MENLKNQSIECSMECRSLENGSVVNDLSTREMRDVNGGFPVIPVIALFIACWDAADGITEGWNSVQ